MSLSYLFRGSKGQQRTHEVKTHEVKPPKEPTESKGFDKSFVSVLDLFPEPDSCLPSDLLRLPLTHESSGVWALGSLPTGDSASHP